ncbi:MAG: hypothetical protein AAF750_01490 [Planctomycetota bacterium]
MGLDQRSSEERGGVKLRSWLWRDRRLWRVFGLAGLVVVLPGLGVLGIWEPVREGVESVRGAEGVVLLGWWGLFVVVSGVLAAGAVLPTHAVSLGMGYVFGIGGGLLGALGAVVIGTVGGWGVARVLVGGRLREVVEGSEAGGVLVRVLVEGDGRLLKVVGAVGLCRLPPQVPFALGNVVGASVGVRLGAFVLGTVLGMGPRVATVVWLGSELEAFERGASDWRVVVGGAVLGGLGLVVLGWWGWRVVKRRAGAEGAGERLDSGND